MPGLKPRIEGYFGQLTRIIYHHRIKFLSGIIIFIAVCSSFLPKLTVDTSTEAMLHKDDPSMVLYNEYKAQFGRTSFVTVLIEAPSIFSRPFLNQLKKLHEDIESKVPYLEEVTSLINVRNTREEEGVFRVDELMSGFEEKSDAALLEIKQRALDNPFYINYVISSDKKSTAIMIETVANIPDKPAFEPDDTNKVDTNKDDVDMDEMFWDKALESEISYHAISADEKAEVNHAIIEVIKSYEAEDFKVTFSGGTVVVDVFNKTTAEDTKRLVKIMTVVIILFLYLLFRRFSGVILPFVIVNAAMVSTLGFMAMTGTPISLMTNLLPGFLVAVGIADAVHVLTIFYREMGEGRSKEDAICNAMAHSGLPIVMTSITTAAGLMSFTIAEIATISEMGYFASAGVILALIYTIVLLPALIAVIPIREKQVTQGVRTSKLMNTVLLFFGRISINHPVKIVSICLILFFVSLYYIFHLEFGNHILNYFPDDHPVKVDLKHVESKLNGSVAFEVVLDTKIENGIHDPSILKGIERLTGIISQFKAEELSIGKIISINDIVKETHQALHENQKEYYTLPTDRDTIAQELFLFENSGVDELERICDSIFSKTRISIRTLWADSVVYDRFMDRLYGWFEEEFNDRAEITVTGLSAIMARTIPAALRSMLKSYVIALIIITILMLILVGDLKLGILSMGPNLLPIFIVMGLIKMAGLTLDINTLFIGSIALGLVVDDTIHFMYNFKKYYQLTGSPDTAIKETLLGTGRAMLITSIVLSVSFFVLLTATLNHSIKFGLFTGIAIVLALLSDFLFAPALMKLGTSAKDVHGDC